ncbi:hypothetical protein OQA88_1859 [Cercophora sp. LCS_1]
MCFTKLLLVGLLVTIPTSFASSLITLNTQDDDWKNISQIVEGRRRGNDTFKYFDRDVCLNFAERLIQESVIRQDDRRIFAFDDVSKSLLNEPTNMAVTYKGCELICGGPTYYVDSGPRFMTWILPIALLLTNIELSATDKWRYFSLAQVTGDPVDALWSLVHKLQTWNRIHDISRARIRPIAGETHDQLIARARIVGAVLAGFEELVGSKANEEYYDQIIDVLGARDARNWHHWEKAALELSDARTDAFSRTTFVIVLYILQVLSSFLPQLGGEPPTPPGGIIACAILLSYLVPTAILSNCIGAFTSRRIPFDILSRLIQSTAPSGNGSPRTASHLIGPEVNTWRTYFHEFHYKGSNPTYRPSKSSTSTSTSESFLTPLLTGLFCILPILAGFAAAFPIFLYATPSGFGCRHIWLIIVVGLWLLSSVFGGCGGVWVEGD